VSEDARLKYRYVDLRRRHAAQHRAAVEDAFAVRECLTSLGFLEIETRS